MIVPERKILLFLLCSWSQSLERRRLGQIRPYEKNWVADSGVFSHQTQPRRGPAGSLDNIPGLLGDLQDSGPPSDKEKSNPDSFISVAVTHVGRQDLCLE